MVLTNHTCPAENTLAQEQSDFWDGRWDAHEIGWVIAGATAAVSTVISLISVFMHARNYYVPKEQRQVIRILLMPAVYGIISFCSYRWFHAYTYYELIVVVYESLVLAAFLMLLLQYIGDSTDEQREVLLEKEKKKLMMPFCCWRYRPSKPYFLHALKWSVLQYSIFRPLISIAGIICEALDVLCPTQYSIYFASVYLDSFDFVSISVALYGLILFYGLIKERLAGKKPLAKFLSIKGIVMVTFYQTFIFSVLESHGVIKATQFWTATNVAGGLAALCTCCEMVIFSAVFMWAFSWKPYRDAREPGAPHTSVLKALGHSFNYGDFVQAGWYGIVFTFRFILGRPDTRSSTEPSAKKLDHPGFDIDNAFKSHSGQTQLNGGGRRSSSVEMTEKNPSPASGSGDYGTAYNEQQQHYQQQQQQQYSNQYQGGSSGQYSSEQRGTLPPPGENYGRPRKSSLVPLSPAHQSNAAANRGTTGGYVQYERASRDEYGVAK